MKVGDILNSTYWLRELLGRGGMGRTFKAEFVPDGRLVVVKTPLEELLLAEDPAALTKAKGRFQRESRLLQRVEHPNIPKVYDVDKAKGWPYFVMQFINGISLDKYLRKSRAPRSEEVAALGVQVVRALAASHKAGVVHRDLKPENIMIAHSGWVYLIDFGIALTVGDDPTRYTNVRVGSDGYMAPERIRTEAGLTDKDLALSDLYSLGCVFYLMFTKRGPFVEQENSAKSIDDQHLEDEPESIRARGFDIPVALDKLVLGLLEKKPGDRPTCEDVLAVLSNYAPKIGDREPNPGFEPDLTLPFRKPEEIHAPEAGPVRRGSGSVRFQRGRPSGFLTLGDVTERLREAEGLLASGDHPSTKELLTTLLSEATRAFGKRHHLVQQIRTALAKMV